MTSGGRRSYEEFILLANKIAAITQVLLHDRRNTGAFRGAARRRRRRGSVDARHVRTTQQQNIQPVFLAGCRPARELRSAFYLRHSCCSDQLMRHRRRLRRGTASGELLRLITGAAGGAGWSWSAPPSRWKERIMADPATRDHRRYDVAGEIIGDIRRALERDIAAGGNIRSKVGVTEDELKSIKVLTVILPQTTRRAPECGR